MYKLWLFVHIVKKFKYYIYMNPLADNQNIHSLLRYELQQSLYIHVHIHIYILYKETNVASSNAQNQNQLVWTKVSFIAPRTTNSFHHTVHGLLKFSHASSITEH